MDKVAKTQEVIKLDIRVKTKMAAIRETTTKLITDNRELDSDIKIAMLKTIDSYLDIVIEGLNPSTPAKTEEFPESEYDYYQKEHS